MLRLDYLSCFLTVVSTVLVARKRWSGLFLAGINSVIICVIGFRTAQFGFIPANLFCIAVYALSIRSWARARKPAPELATAGAHPPVAAHQPPRPARPRKANLQIVYRARVLHGTQNAQANEASTILQLVSSGKK